MREVPPGRPTRLGRWELAGISVRESEGLGPVHGGVLDLCGHTDLVCDLASSADGRRLATGSMDRTIKLRDTTSGEEVFTLRGHTTGLTCVAFSPDGRRLASGSWGRTVRIWDTSPPASHALSRRGAESRVEPAELPDDPLANDR